MELNETLVQILGMVVGIAASVVAYAIRKVVNRLLVKMEANDQQKEAIDALLEGMAVAQEALVREAKLAAQDGKLTKEEIEKAKALAIEHAKMVLKGPAKDLFFSWSQSRLDSIIKQLLAKMKE